MFAMSFFYTLTNSTNKQNDITFILKITSFSQLFNFYTTFSNINIFTKFEKSIYLNLSRYILFLTLILLLILLMLI